MRATSFLRGQDFVAVGAFEHGIIILLENGPRLEKNKFIQRFLRPPATIRRGGWSLDWPPPAGRINIWRKFKFQPSARKIPGPGKDAESRGSGNFYAFVFRNFFILLFSSFCFRPVFFGFPSFKINLIPLPTNPPMLYWNKCPIWRGQLLSKGAVP